MTRLEVYDPAMCCSTGVCGPEVDPRLVRFSADMDWIAKQGIEVARFNIAQEPGAFVGNEVVKAALTAGGNNVLPLVLIDGDIVCRGFYPERMQLQTMLKIEAPIVAERSKSGGCCGGSPPEQADKSSSNSCC